MLHAFERCLSFINNTQVTQWLSRLNETDSINATENSHMMYTNYESLVGVNFTEANRTRYNEINTITQELNKEI